MKHGAHPFQKHSFFLVDANNILNGFIITVKNAAAITDPKFVRIFLVKLTLPPQYHYVSSPPTNLTKQWYSQTESIANIMTSIPTSRSQISQFINFPIFINPRLINVLDMTQKSRQNKAEMMMGNQMMPDIYEMMKGDSLNRSRFGFWQHMITTQMMNKIIEMVIMKNSWRVQRQIEVAMSSIGHSQTQIWTNTLVKKAKSNGKQMAMPFDRSSIVLPRDMSLMMADSFSVRKKPQSCPSFLALMTIQAKRAVRHSHMTSQMKSAQVFFWTF